MFELIDELIDQLIYELIDINDYLLNWIKAWIDKYVLKVKSPIAMRYFGYEYMYDLMKNNYKVNDEAFYAAIDHMNKLAEIYSKGYTN